MKCARVITGREWLQAQAWMVVHHAAIKALSGGIATEKARQKVAAALAKAGTTAHPGVPPALGDCLPAAKPADKTAKAPLDDSISAPPGDCDVNLTSGKASPVANDSEPADPCAAAIPAVAAEPKAAAAPQTAAEKEAAKTQKKAAAEENAKARAIAAEAKSEAKAAKEAAAAEKAAAKAAAAAEKAAKKAEAEKEKQRKKEESAAKKLEKEQAAAAKAQRKTELAEEKARCVAPWLLLRTGRAPP